MTGWCYNKLSYCHHTVDHDYYDLFAMDNYAIENSTADYSLSMYVGSSSQAVCFSTQGRKRNSKYPGMVLFFSPLGFLLFFNVAFFIHFSRRRFWKQIASIYVHGILWFGDLCGWKLINHPWRWSGFELCRLSHHYNILKINYSSVKSRTNMYCVVL